MQKRRPTTKRLAYETVFPHASTRTFISHLSPRTSQDESGAGATYLLLNGMPVDITTFNLYGLIDQIRSEVWGRLWSSEAVMVIVKVKCLNSAAW